MEIVQSILTKNPCYKSGKKISVKGIMLHSAGCPQPSAKVFIHNWNRGSCDNKCVHAFIDANDGKIYQTLPWNHKGWHSGRHPVTKQSANDTHISVEMCEPYQLKYKKEFEFTLDSEEEKASAISCVKKMYASAVELCAQLCTEFGLNPMTDIISHKEGYQHGVASDKGDPEHLWELLGLPYSMDTFRTDVKDQMVKDEASTYRFEEDSDIAKEEPNEAPDTQDAISEKTEEKPVQEADTPKEMLIRIDVENLRIRSGPGTNFDPIGKYTGVGIFEIVEIREGAGSNNGWGKLKNTDGWVCLDYTKNV